LQESCDVVPREPTGIQQLGSWKPKGEMSHQKKHITTPIARPATRGGTSGRPTCTFGSGSTGSAPPGYGEITPKKERGLVSGCLPPEGRWKSTAWRPRAEGAEPGGEGGRKTKKKIPARHAAEPIGSPSKSLKKAPREIGKKNGGDTSLAFGRFPTGGEGKSRPDARGTSSWQEATQGKRLVTRDNAKAPLINY